MTARVLFVNHEQRIGGAERMLLALLEALPRDRIEPALAVPGEGALAAAARALDVPVHGGAIDGAALRLRRGSLAGLAAAARMPGAARDVARVARVGRFDVVCTNSMKAHLYGTVAARLAGVPAVWRLHDCLDREAWHPVLLRVVAAAGRWARAVLCVSDAVARYAIDAGLAPWKTRTIRNGVDLERLRPPEGAGEGARVGIVGRLDPWKGHDTFLRAAALVARRVPDAAFAVVGGPQFDGDRRAEDLRALARDLGLAGRVTFAGHRDDVRSLLAEMDVFVHASHAPDPLPTTVIEALAMARPVVATATGGVPEILDGGRCGLLVPPRDPEAMAGAVVSLLTDRAAAAALGRAGRRRAEDAFDGRRQNLRLAEALVESSLAPARAARTGVSTRVAGRAAGRREGA